MFGRSRSLIGIVCRPTVAPRRTDSPFVVFLNSGIIHRVGPHRIYVKIARALAQVGIGSLRFDLGGIGDSSVATDEQGEVKDFVQRDIKDAVEWVTENEKNKGIIVIGLCSGADNSLQTAVNDGRIVGMVLIDPNVHQPISFYLYHYSRRIFSKNTWLLLITGKHPVYNRIVSILGKSSSKEVQNSDPDVFVNAKIPTREERNKELKTIIERSHYIYYIFTGGMVEQYNHKYQIFKCYSSLKKSNKVSLSYFRESDHTFSSPLSQKKLISSVVSWMNNYI